jgi:hypothetical protein
MPSPSISAALRLTLPVPQSGVLACHPEGVLAKDEEDFFRNRTLRAIAIPA